jgi:hypothetical protein
MDASQNLLVLRDGETYKALSEFTHEVAFQSDRAQPVIQYALAAMGGAGGVVTLGRGDFVLDGPLDLHDNVWLRGSGRGTRLLVGEQAGDGPGIMGRDIKGAVVSDLALTPLREARVAAGIVLDNAGDCKVRDIAAVGFGDYGVWVRNNAFLCEVRGCSLAGNGKANLFFDHLARGEHGDFIPNLAANCVIYGGGKGIECSRSIVLNIVGCVVYQAGDVAYHVHNTSNSVLISGCRSFQITGHAVLVEDSHEFNLSGNVFCWHTEHGVAVRSCNWGTITGNEVIDSGSYNSGAADTTTNVADLPGDVPLYNGIDLVGVKGFAVSSNAVFNWPVAPHMAIGIREDEKSVRNVITDNNVNYYTEAGVISGGAETEVQGNVCYADEPYQSPQGVGTTAQSFRRELTEAFIRDLLNLGEV